MPGPEVAAPELGVAGLLALSLLALLAWAMLRGTAAAWRMTFGWLLLRLGALLRIDVWRLHWHPGDAIIRWNNELLHVITKQAAKSEHAAGYLFHEAALLQGWITRELLHFANEVYATLDWFAHTKIGKVLKYALPVGVITTLVLRLIRAELRRERPHTAKAAKAAAATAPPVTIIRRVALPHAGEWAWIHRHWKALTAAVTGAGAIALPRPVTWPQFRRSWREIAAWRHTTGKRLARLEKLLAASGLALAVANMTGTSVRCWRGQGSIARAARHLCGLERWALDLLLLGSVEAFVATDLCEFSYLLRKEAELIRPALLELVAVEDALIGCHGAEKPRLFVLPPADPTPLQGVSPLAA